jgi:N6-adenosine-specific RNA methylase IME4
MTDLRADSLFAPLPVIEGGWCCVSGDAPLRFASNCEARPGRNAMRHYRCLPLSVIATLPVKEVVAEDAWLFLWITGPFLAIGAHLPIFRAWGFRPSGMGFDWIKVKRSAWDQTFQASEFSRALHFGGGFTTRKNAEYVVIGRRGRPKRLSASVRSTIIAPVREHSRKPDEVYRLIEEFCPGPRLELFAREHRDGWTAWGNETTKFNRQCEDNGQGRSERSLSLSLVGDSDLLAATRR